MGMSGHSCLKNPSMGNRVIIYLVEADDGLEISCKPVPSKNSKKWKFSPTLITPLIILFSEIAFDTLFCRAKSLKKKLH